MSITYYLGAAYYEPALRRLVAVLDIRGRRGQLSLSELVGRLADATDFDFEQTAARLDEIFTVAARFVEPTTLGSAASGWEVFSVPERGAAESGARSLNVHLGAHDAARRRAALERLAEHFGISVSAILRRVANATLADEGRTTLLAGDIMNIAAQSYIAESEAMQQEAADRRPTAGKYPTERAAKQAADRATNPVVVRFADGSHDWYRSQGVIGYVLDGHTIPYDRGQYQIVSRHVVGRGWKATNR